MMSASDKILVRYQNSDKILLEKQNCKENFDFETRLDVYHDVCVNRNSAVISELWQNSAA